MSGHNLMRCNKCNYHWFMGLLWYGGKIGQICSKCKSEDIQFILAVRGDLKEMKLTIINKPWKQNYDSTYSTFENINENLVESS